ncbi:MAG: hypothetical protein DRJ45_07410 [Thermoprotei archaeon]|nr:MAG: hypothetical protein DRJ45_07410 [Thermoprotei archaeon]
MSENNKIHIKIELEKNPHYGNIVLKTQFDPNAPNFFYDKDGISWCPTSEESEFINEAFELMSKGQGGHFENKIADKTTSNKIHIKIQLEKNPHYGDLVIKAQFDPNAPNFFEDKETKTISWCPSTEEIEFINEAFGLMPKSRNTHFINKKELEKKTELDEKTERVNTEKNKESIDKDITEKITSNKNIEEFDFERRKEEKLEGNVTVVSADSKTIDELVNKNKEGKDDFMVEASEGTILNKVLKQKKKGKW